METATHNTCKNCGYYRQHYIWSQGYQLVNGGHCVHPPRTRRCRPEMSACAKWIPQDDNYRNTYIPPE